MSKENIDFICFRDRVLVTNANDNVSKILTCKMQKHNIKLLLLYVTSHNNMLQKYIDRLSEFISYPSISTIPRHKEDMNRTAEYLRWVFDSHGFEARLLTWFWNPIIIATYHHDINLPTCLIYGHYDIQPAENAADWKSGRPFFLSSDNERLYARGVVDNKGQVMIHMSTIFDLIEEGNLKYNVTFLIEGDEETWEWDTEACIRKHADLLQANFAMISDWEMIGDSIPTMVSSFRGGANIEVNLQTAPSDMHSGTYGNIIPSASHDLIRLVGRIHDAWHNIVIPGWHNWLSFPPARSDIEPFNLQQLTQQHWITWTSIPVWYDHITAIWMPTIQISGLQSWYMWEGFQNIIPGKASAKLNLRFSSGQDPSAMVELFKKRCTDNKPDYSMIDFTVQSPYPAITIDTDNQITKDTIGLLKDVYKTEPIMRPCGASVPITWELQDILWHQVLVVDLANEDCNMHGVDENFKISSVKKGLEFSRKFFAKE